MGVSQYMVWKTLKKHRLHPYHYTRVQELHPGDAAKRLDFCRYLLAQPDNILKKILWTDECKLDRNGITNVHNLHVWSEVNPHAKRESKHQRQFSVNLWAGILDNQLIGPYVLPDNINGANYLDFLQNQLPVLLENVPLVAREDMIFQHDGCPAHFHRIVRAHLDQRFTNRWIGRGGPTPWPPRSPDITPLDFYLWGRMKEIVYFEPVSSKEILLQRIQHATDVINNEMTSNVTTTEIKKRARLCIRENGSHFENLL